MCLVAEETHYSYDELVHKALLSEWNYMLVAWLESVTIVMGSESMNNVLLKKPYSSQLLASQNSFLVRKFRELIYLTEGSCHRPKVGKKVPQKKVANRGTRRILPISVLAHVHYSGIVPKKLKLYFLFLSLTITRDLVKV